MWAGWAVGVVVMVVVGVFETLIFETLEQPDVSRWGFTGRNIHVFKEYKKLVGEYKPRLGVHEVTLEPDDAQFLAAVRAGMVGSIDPTDNMLQVVKSSAVWRKRKGEPRRFVPGHTCFRSMSGLPILAVEAMPKVTFEEREKVFRGIIATAKFSGRGAEAAAAGAAAGAAAAVPPQPDEGDEAEEEDDDDVVELGIITPTTKVVLFWMELHPKVCFLAYGGEEGTWYLRGNAETCVFPTVFRACRACALWFSGSHLIVRCDFLFGPYRFGCGVIFTVEPMRLEQLRPTLWTVIGLEL